MSSAFDINRRLIRQYGRAVDHDVPLFRVVRSETQTEKRAGEYNVFYGDIFLRTEKGCREIIKYWYLPPCWILEKYEPVMNRGTYEIIKEPYTYEPLYSFVNEQKESLPLLWRPIELVVQAWLNAERKFKRTQKDDDLDEMAKIAKERKDIYDMLNDGKVLDALSYGEGVFIPSKKEEVKDGESNSSLVVPVSS